MNEKDAPERFSFSRWSRRKLDAKAEVAAAPAAAPALAPAAATVSSAASSAPPASAPQLPSLDSLSFDSDFAAFLRPEVDETIKRAALKQLFRDPRFNVMDGLDVYIDDYTKADPIPPDVLKDILQRGFAAVTPASSTSPDSAAPPVPTGGVPAPPAAKPLPSAVAASSASASDPQSPQLPQLPEHAPEHEVPPRSTS